MFPNPRPWRALSLALLAGFVASCGAVGNGLQTQQLDPGQQQQVAPQDQQQMRDPLNLTQEQIQRLRAIMQRQGGRESREAMQARIKRLEAILTAPQIDVQALTEHLRQERDQMRTRLADTISHLVQFHAILTPEQRLRLRDLIGQAPEEAGPQDELATRLNLTAEQQAALKSLHAPEAGKAFRKAFRRFLRTGDQESLRANLEDAVSMLPDPENVANAIAGLTPEQRKQLFTRRQEQAPQSQQSGMSQGQQPQQPSMF